MAPVYGYEPGDVVFKVNFRTTERKQVPPEHQPSRKGDISDDPVP